MKTSEAPQNGVTVVLVVGRNEDGTPGFAALDLGTGDTFQHYGRCVGDLEPNRIEDRFAAWKAGLGSVVTIVELNRGAASVHFAEEMRLPASLGVTQIDLSSMLIGVSTIVGEEFNLNTRLTANKHDLIGQARQQGVIYLAVIKMYASVAGMFKAAGKMKLVYESSEALG
jgi:hypothetical protein